LLEGKKEAAGFLFSCHNVAGCLGNDQQAMAR